MKKQWLGLAVLAVIVLGGCGQKQASKPSSSSAKSSQTSSQKAKAKAKSSQSSSQASSSTTAPAQTHLATLQSALRKQIPGAKFPQQDPATNGQALNVAAEGTAASYKLYFSFGAAAFQASALPRANASYVLTKTTPESTAAAKAADAAINYQALQAGLPTVALGDGLTGTKEGAAGSTYVTWHEGRWSLVASGVNQNQEDPVALAKQAVSFLAQASLPIPATHGAVVLHVAKSSDRVNTVAWRENSAYYQLSGIDPLMTLRMATLLR